MDNFELGYYAQKNDDLKKAKEYYRKGANEGDIKCMNNLALLILEDLKNLDEEKMYEAHELLLDSIRGGNILAHDNYLKYFQAININHRYGDILKKSKNMMFSIYHIIEVVESLAKYSNDDAATLYYRLYAQSRDQTLRYIFKKLQGEALYFDGKTKNDIDVLDKAYLEFLDIEDYNHALETINYILEIVSDKNQRNIYLYEKGRVLKNMKRYDDARMVFEGLENPTSRFMTGKTYYQEGRYEEAMEMFLSAFEDNKFYTKVYYYYTLAHLGKEVDFKLIDDLIPDIEATCFALEDNSLNEHPNMLYDEYDNYIEIFESATIGGSFPDEIIKIIKEGIRYIQRIRSKTSKNTVIVKNK